MNTLSFDLTQIKDAAFDALEKAKGHQVWALHGEMGAGKTTFIHAVCEILGITSAFGSPTYSIINEYNTEKAGTVYHIDCYRLKDEEEAVQAGIEDTLLSGSLCFVEWPEKVPTLLPDNCIHLYLRVVDVKTRQLSFEQPVTSSTNPLIRQ